MAERKKYKKRSDSFVIAIQLDLDTDGFKYRKWGAEQFAKRGDWLVDNNGEKYTVSQQSFGETYELVSPGVYVKSAPVWAEVAERAGKVQTQEGETNYRAGDYLVYNDENGADAYAVEKDRFDAMYEPVTE
jgi:hypothetical protein